MLDDWEAMFDDKEAIFIYLMIGWLDSTESKTKQGQIAWLCFAFGLCLAIIHSWLQCTRARIQCSK